MPFLFVNGLAVDTETRQELTGELTNAVSHVCEVPADKIQIFFRPSMPEGGYLPPSVLAHLVAGPDTAALRAAIEDVMHPHMAAPIIDIEPFPAEYTARGGRLRTASPRPA